MADSPETSTGKSTKRFRQWLRLAFGIALVAGCVAFVLRSSESRDALRSVSPGTLGWLVLMQAGYLLIDSYRYLAGLPERHRLQIPFWEWTRVFGVGRLLNNAIPQSGTAYRATTMRGRWGLPVPMFLVSLILVTWFGTGILLALVGLILFGYGQSDTWLGVAYLLIGVAVVFVLGVLLRSRTRPSKGSRSVRWGRRFWDSKPVIQIRAAALSPDRTWKVASTSIALQVVGFSIYWITFAGLGISDAPIRAVALYAASTAATLISLTPAGLGITELATAFAGTAIAVPASLSILVVLVVRLTGLLGVAVVSAVLSMLLTASRGTAARSLPKV